MKQSLTIFLEVMKIINFSHIRCSIVMILPSIFENNAILEIQRPIFQAFFLYILLIYPSKKHFENSMTIKTQKDLQSCDKLHDKHWPSAFSFFPSSFCLCKKILNTAYLHWVSSKGSRSLPLWLLSDAPHQLSTWSKNVFYISVLYVFVILDALTHSLMHIWMPLTSLYPLFCILEPSTILVTEPWPCLETVFENSFLI